MNALATPSGDIQSAEALVKEVLSQSILNRLRCARGKTPENASNSDVYYAIGHSLRDHLVGAIMDNDERWASAGAKRVHYLSMEFLVGRLTENNLINLKIYDTVRDVLEELGFELNAILNREHDPALGNGGLGRLAACFLDSMATQGIPGFGYGINYEFGLFRQSFVNGYQREAPDHWLVEGTPWQIERTEARCVIPIYGRIVESVDHDGNYNPMWMEWRTIEGVPHDLPIVGYGGETVNYLRLYAARASDEFDMGVFNEGDYLKAVEEKIYTETVSKVLYPEDSFEAGKELRLVQEYFFVACAIRDIIRKHEEVYGTVENFAEKNAIQLNDTHPALAVAELMRFFIDERSFSWDRAIEMTVNSCAYTNHTLLPEALETWPVEIIEKVLPRHLGIIRGLDRHFAESYRQSSLFTEEKLKKLSVCGRNSEHDSEIVRMANLSIIGSHSVNGVAAMHSKLVTSSLVPDFYDLWPERFNNKTNGVTQRRWLLQANPDLASLITESIGSGWITDLSQLRELEKYSEDADFLERFTAVKQKNKKRLADLIEEKTRIVVDQNSMFDIQAKRIHEYKRQLLCALHIIHQYFSIIEDGVTLPVPRTYVFAGKAAPGYILAKRIIKLINNLAMVINQDRRVAGQLTVVFIPNYNVTAAERIFPGADLSEQISTAGFEASGTGNMKFALNGALTIGTLDGANVEILEEVGEENIFIFGLKAEEITKMKSEQSYNPWSYYESDPRIKRIMDSLVSDKFCPGEPDIFLPIYKSLLSDGDYFFNIADIASYIEAQEKVGMAFFDRKEWSRKALLNVARMGKFSSDRSIAEYARDIWNVPVTT